MAIAVDTNVIIYERTKEELFAGKSIKQAYTDGFKHALNAIIDGHLTSLLTALVLFIFGTGPIKGFAVTTGIGLIMTFFTSVLLSRVMIFHRLNKGKSLSVWTPITKNWFRNLWIDFIGKRKYAYIFSAVLTTACIISMVKLGFKTGVDFKGGRSYVVRFDKNVESTKAHESLAKLFVINGEQQAVDVKTFGNEDQLKITTDYKINDESIAADQDVEQKLYQGLFNTCLLVLL
jgi:SecD/SecF fusion protein